MTLLPILVVAVVGAGASIGLARLDRSGRLGQAIGLAALLLVLVLGLALPSPAPTAVPPEATASLMDRGLLASDHLRLVVVLWSGLGLLLAILAMLVAPLPALPAATLATLAAAVVALGSPDPLVGLLGALVAGLCGLVATLPPRAGQQAASRDALPIGVAARELRMVVAATVAVIAGAVVAPAVTAHVGTAPSDGTTLLGPVAPAIGAATLAIALGLALRGGAVPFHLWAARLADVAPAAALPLVLGWAPLALGTVAIAVVDAEVAPLALPLDGERLLIVAAALLTLGGGALAAWIQEDVQHLVGYVAVSAAGVVLLAVAALDPAAYAPARAWLVVLAAALSALAAWSLAAGARFGTRRLPELAGWARRAPALAVGLGLATIALVGLPGWAAWEARRGLAELAPGGPLAMLAWIAGLLIIAPIARVFAVGVGRPTALVAGAPSERPVVAGLAPARTDAGSPARPRTGAVATARAWTRASGAAVGANRAPIASGLVVTIALVAALVGAGGFGLLEASAERHPTDAALLTPSD